MQLNDSIFEPQVIILGVFGNTNKIKELDLQDNILNVILQELGRSPDKVLIPSEGNSSVYIQEWAETCNIKTDVFYCDWMRNGKIAQIIRDDRIQKECTHALVFLSDKSVKLEKMGEKMAKNGKTVFTSSFPYQDLEMLVVEPVQKPLKALGRGRKSDIGKGQTLLKFQKKVEC
jgi:hypothetical protein